MFEPALIFVYVCTYSGFQHFFFVQADLLIEQWTVCVPVHCFYHEKGCFVLFHVQVLACTHTSKVEDYVEPATLSHQSCQMRVSNFSDQLKWSDSVEKNIVCSKWSRRIQLELLSFSIFDTVAQEV